MNPMKIAPALLAAGLCLSSVGFAQTAPAAPAAVTPSPKLAGIAHIAIRVKDIAASVAFYNKLGYEQAFFMTGRDGSVSQSFIKINDRQFIELYPVTAQNAEAGFLHLCFEGNDLYAVHDYYVAEGLTPIDVRKAGAGNLLFTLKGLQQFSVPQNIEYTQYMPGSLHSKDFGLHPGADHGNDKMTVVTLAMQDPAAARAFYNDKLAFVPVPGGSRLAWRFGLPGASGAVVEIVPVESLGAKSSITVTTPILADVRLRLTQQGIPFSKVDGQPDALVVTDPDGSIIKFEAQSAMRR